LAASASGKVLKLCPRCAAIAKKSHVAAWRRE
jgi:hypothetical protein